jgi:hypothetical protein
MTQAIIDVAKPLGTAVPEQASHAVPPAQPLVVRPDAIGLHALSSL